MSDATPQNLGFIDVGYLKQHQLEGGDLHTSSLPRVVACPACRALVSADDAKAHAGWHRTPAGVSDSPNCQNCRSSSVLAHVELDYVQWWECENCTWTWNRWPAEHPFFPLAEKLRLSHLEVS